MLKLPIVFSPGVALLSTTHLPIDGQNVAIKYLELLNPDRMTVYRVTLESKFKFRTVIVKQRKEGWDEEFKTEKEAYERLSNLQGDLIPHFLGECEFEGCPALILSDIPGNHLGTVARHDLDISAEAVEKSLHTVLRALYDQGAEQWDSKLDNFIFSAGKVVAIDFERIQCKEDPGPWEENVNFTEIEGLMEQFRCFRDPYRGYSLDLIPMPPRRARKTITKWEFQISGCTKCKGCEINHISVDRDQFSASSNKIWKLISRKGVCINHMCNVGETGKPACAADEDHVPEN